MQITPLISAAVVAAVVVTALLATTAFKQTKPDLPRRADGASAASVPGPAGSVPAVINPVTQTETEAEAARNEAELVALFHVVAKPKTDVAGPIPDPQGERGRQVYLGLCYACHQPDGQGVPKAFPMLAKSDFMLADRTRAIRIVLQGMTGPVTVNGETINSVMPPQEAVLTDAQVADVLTYVFNAWGNRGDPFTAEQVKAVRHEKR